MRLLWLEMLLLTGLTHQACPLVPIPGLELKVASKPQAVPVAMALGSSANLYYVYIVLAGGC